MQDTSPTSTAGSRVFEEFSPKDILLRVRSTGAYIAGRWIPILIFALVCGAAGAVYTYLKKPTYSAELTFALDEGAAQSAKSDYSQIAEQLGIGQVMDAGGVFSSITNIVELMQSRLLIEKTLRTSVELGGKPLFFADLFLDSLRYRDKWMKGSPYRNMDLVGEKKSREEELFANGILRNIYETLLSKHLKIDKKGKGTTIISASCTSENESFSKYFLEAWIEEVTHYYIATKTARAKLNVEFIQHRTDSVRDAYNSALYGRAAFSDAHTNPIRQIASVSGEKQQTDVQILRATYTDLSRSLESAKTTLMRETPLIQYLDVPILPLKMAQGNVLMRFGLFFAVGAVLMAVFLLLNKIYRFILSR